MHVRFHYLGEEAHSPRLLEMWMPEGMRVLISRQDGPYPVVMQPFQAYVMPQPPIAHADSPPMGFDDDDVQESWAAGFIAWMFGDEDETAPRTEDCEAWAAMRN